MCPSIPASIAKKRPKTTRPARKIKPAVALTLRLLTDGYRRPSSSLLDRGGQGRAQARFVIAGWVQPPVDEQRRGAAGAALQGAVGVGLNPPPHTAAVQVGRQPLPVQPELVG